MSDMDALRAEVERWRDDYIKADEERAAAGLGMSTHLGSYADAYQTVLDLIDRGAEKKREAGQ